MDTDSCDKSQALEMNGEAVSNTVTKQHSHSDKPRPYLCTVCDKWFKTKEYLTIHRKSHNHENFYPCTQCEKRFSTRSARSRHMNIHTEKYMCTECGRCCLNTNDLAMHARSHSREKPIECSVCGKRFTRPSCLLVHSRIHGREKLYKCYVCDKAFSQCSNLHNHLRVHISREQYKYLPCNKSLSRSSTLHQDKCCAQSNKRPYKCPRCEIVFYGNGPKKLKRHLLTSHNEGKWFTCDICQKKVTERYILRAHMKRHEGLKPYLCSECPKRFCTARELTYHQTVHSEARQFSCSLCFRMYKRKKDAERHFVTLHSTDIM